MIMFKQRNIIYAFSLTVLAMSVHLFWFETNWNRVGTFREIVLALADFSPNMAFLPNVLGPMVETLVMALWGTLIGVMLSFPIALISAANITPNRFITYPLGRGLIVIFRSTHEIIFALIFVAAVGLGPLAGICALATRCIGFMAKTTAEAIENVQVGPIEGVAATGASPMAQFRYAIIPQVLPIFIGNVIFQIDINIRRAAILGMVGAGGLGLLFSQQIQNYNYGNVGTCILAVVVLVVFGELASKYIRAKLIEG
jgi:phosphonate transport system permease protein